MNTYKAVIVGLTGIGARRPEESPDLPLYGVMPRSHAAAYYRHAQTEVVGVCDIRQEALDGFIVQHAGWKELQGNGPTEPGVFTPIHDAHAAGSDEPCNPVVADDLTLQIHGRIMGSVGS